MKFALHIVHEDSGFRLQFNFPTQEKAMHQYLSSLEAYSHCDVAIARHDEPGHTEVILETTWENNPYNKEFSNQAKDFN